MEAAAGIEGVSLCSVGEMGKVSRNRGEPMEMPRDGRRAYRVL